MDHKCSKKRKCLGSLTHDQTQNKITTIEGLHQGDASIKRMRVSDVIYAALKETLNNNNKTLKSTGDKIPIEFKDTFYGSDNTKPQEAVFCEGCMQYIYDIPQRSYERAKRIAKETILIKQKIDYIEQNYGKIIPRRKKKNVEEEGALFTNVLQAKAFFGKAQKAGLSKEFADAQDLKLMCLPSSPASTELFHFLDDFFETNCDRPPNKTENRCELPASTYSKKHIYDIYLMHHSEEECPKPASIKTFYAMWNNLFPNVKIVKYLAVAGKCSICAEIYHMEEQCKTLQQMEDLKKIKIFHRLFVQKFKYGYYMRREKARRFRELYMSIISDGMQQEHCKNPYFANQKTNPNVVSQHIQGTISHGFQKSLNRSLPHVLNGFNVNAHVILSDIMDRLKHCEENNECFPRTLFLQVDGGAENTAKAMFGLCEFLVEQKVFDRIELSRLPVGHTHEDIDAMFGTIWTRLRTKTMLSPDEFKTEVMLALKAIRTDVIV